MWVLSPDGDRVALRIGQPGEGDIWVKELDRGPQVRVTSMPGEERLAAWLDDETLLVLIEGETGLDAYAVRADGAGEPRILYDHETSIAHASVDGDGTWMAFSTGIERFTAEGPVGGDLFALRLRATEPARRILETSGYAAGGATLDPTGRTIAYQASPTGRDEVIVRPFPDLQSGRTQVSVAGGASPRWSSDGSALYYVDDQWRMIEATVTPGPTLRVVRRPLFTVRHELSRAADVALNGSFLMARSDPVLVLVFGWQDIVE